MAKSAKAPKQITYIELAKAIKKLGLDISGISDNLEEAFKTKVCFTLVLIGCGHLLLFPW